MNSELVYRIIKCYINEYAAPDTTAGTAITPFFLETFSKKRDIKYGAHTMFRVYSAYKEPSYYLNLMASPVKSETVEKRPIPGAPNEMPVLADRIHAAALELLWILRDVPCEAAKGISDLAQELELDLAKCKASSPKNYEELAHKIDRYLAANQSSEDNLERFNFKVALIQYSELLKFMDPMMESIEAGFPKVTHSEYGKLTNPYDVAASIAAVIFWASKTFADPSGGEPHYYIENTRWTFDRMNDMLENILQVSEASKSLESFLEETNIPIRVRTFDTITSDQELAVETRLKDLQKLLTPFAVKAVSDEYDSKHTPGAVAKKALSRAGESDTVLAYIFDAIDDCAKIIRAEIVA
jgi:hypothetical protein